MTFAADKAAQVAHATAVIAQAQGYLDRLVAQADAILITGTTTLPEQYDYNSVPVVNFPVLGATRPTISVAALAALPESPSVSFSTLVEIPFPADDILAPTSVFSFAEADYESVLLDPLKVKLLDNLENGGYGIETADEIALFNRARDREVEATMLRVAEAGRSMAARGFPLPPGELSVHIDRAYQEQQSKISSVSRDIALKRADLFVENRKFTITEVRELERITIGFWNSIQERAFNVARVSAEFGITVYNALLARYRVRFDAAKAQSDVQLQKFQTETEQVRARLEVFRGQVLGYEAQLRGLIDPAKLAVDVYRADIDAVRATNDAGVSKATLQQKVIEATALQNNDITRMTIENARVRLLGVTESLRLKTAASQFGADKFYAQLTAIESSINTLSVSTEAI